LGGGGPFAIAAENEIAGGGTAGAFAGGAGVKISLYAHWRACWRGLSAAMRLMGYYGACIFFRCRCGGMNWM